MRDIQEFVHNFQNNQEQLSEINKFLADRFDEMCGNVG